MTMTTGDKPHDHEPRSRVRHTPASDIDVYDNTRDQYLGRLVNIHQDGLMVIGDHPFEEDCLYKLDLHLPQPVNGCNSVHIGVDCLWARNADDNGKHWAGFSIIDASPQVLEVIEHLMEQTQ